MPELIDPFFAKKARNTRMTENEHFGLVFAKTGSINSGTGLPIPVLVSLGVMPYMEYGVLQSNRK